MTTVKNRVATSGAILTRKIKMSNKANEEVLNSLHLMVAEEIAKLMREAKGEPELMLKVLREARGFLKDNNVTADMEANAPLKKIRHEVASVKLANLPFEVEEE